MAPSDQVIERTASWLRRAVIGLNLCPFAKGVVAKRQLRYVVSDATTTEALSEALADELRRLAAAPPDEHDTTLLIHPAVLGDFRDYNDFLREADAVLRGLDLRGVLQIASFHPRYQFAGTLADDVENCTNRSPFPLLHLLREASVRRAVEAFPDAALIFDKNVATMRDLGHAGWSRVLDAEEP